MRDPGNEVDLNKLLMTFLDGKGGCLILIGKKIESHYFL